MRLLPFLLFALLFSPAVLAQEQKPSEKPKPENTAQKEESKRSNNDAPRFVDEDGDGVDDGPQTGSQPTNAEHKQHQLRDRRRDHFIDTDNDGINDQRCSGMGIEHPGRRRGGRR